MEIVAEAPSGCKESPENKRFHFFLFCGQIEKAPSSNVQCDAGFSWCFF
jgi:hypothetical protein